MSDDETEVAETQAAEAVAWSLENAEQHPNAELEMTLGHMCNAGYAGCWHTGESCSGDGDCAQATLSTAACDMCSSTLAGYREMSRFGGPPDG